MTDPRSRITAGELAVVLSRYDLGAIESISRFRGGSRQSPKVLVVSQRGKFLLKRRSPQDSADAHAHTRRVAFSHAVAAHLSRHAFPLAEIIPPRDRTGPDLTIRADDRVYELFRFIEGDRYDHRPASAAAAGDLLARFHDALKSWTPPEGAATGTYHNRPQFPARLEAARERIDDPRARPLASSLGGLYARAAERAESLGVSRQSVQVIHGDWHPGNMIFRSGGPSGVRAEVAAVVDLDSARIGPTIVDLANGAMQFAAIRKFASPDDSRAGLDLAPLNTPADAPPHDPQAWRIAMDPQLVGEFCAGYRRAFAGGPLDSPDLVRAIPFLMAEALIVEAVLPIAATGAFGRLDPLPFLALIDRTASTILAEHERVAALAAGTSNG